VIAEGVVSTVVSGAVTIARHGTSDEIVEVLTVTVKTTVEVTVSVTTTVFVFAAPVVETVISAHWFDPLLFSAVKEPGVAVVALPEEAEKTKGGLAVLATDHEALELAAAGPLTEKVASSPLFPLKHTVVDAGAPLTTVAVGLDEVTVLIAADAEVTDKVAVPKATTAISEIRLSSVFVDIYFLSDCRTREFL
jgi:hypothetical protein